MPEVGSRVEPRTGALMDARVLAVDDDESVRRLLASFCQRLGLRMEQASDGREALTKFQAAPDRFDLVLLDLTMPGMSGEEVFAGIREQRPHIPVVLVSGYTPQDVLRRIGNAAGVMTLDKPFSMAAFQNVISQAMGDAATPSAGVA